MTMRRTAVLLGIGVFLNPGLLRAQGSYSDYVENPANVEVDAAFFAGMKFRDIGFSRGGRSTAATGVPGQPLVYYFGGTGGGVFKTVDAGNNWTNVTDGFLGVGSIGAVAVAPSDPNVVYVGTGSACPRGNISVGDGVYKSTDAGKTWKHVGLRAAGQIGKIHVHPRDPDVVFVAALGQIFGPNADRGVFRSKDGGKTWEKALFISETTGVVDLSLDPGNPRVLFAAAWRAERKPWTMISGSEDSGIYRSTDGGDSWKKLEGGLPSGLVGRGSVAVSPANGNRVFVLLEAEEDKGGVYRSEDGGDKWTRINGDAALRQRPWYYIHIYADTKDENTVYVLNVQFFKSIDGGKTFDTRIEVPHGDNHDLWINPDDPKNMINANDGGANVSFDGGASWSTQRNQPTAEIYRVVVDDQWPYRVYGSQQDNSTISVPMRAAGGFGGSVVPDWYSVGGCESGHIAVDPRDADVVYAGCYGGSIQRLNRKTGEIRQILNYPQLQLGAAPRDLKYRFQWNAPIRLSPHDPDILYHASQVVHMSRDDGQSWTVISPDLTTDNPEHQDYAGGPITHDSTGVEVYGTVFAFEESPQTPGLLWAGSDDGRVHLSRDRGGSWTEITPRSMPGGGTVNMIELSPHDAGRAFIAVHRYRQNDFRPYIFRTADYGASWELLTDGKNGIPETSFTRAVREDPVKKGLLYAGTEFGMYVSFDDGAHWQRFQLNLPVTPVTDIRVHRSDLVLSTQGRAFWILDDVSPLRQLGDDVRKAESWLYAPRTAYRGGGSDGASVYYYFSKLPDKEVTLEILDGGGQVLRTFKGKAGEAAEPRPSGFGGFFGGGADPKVPVALGINRFTWNLREKGPEMPRGVVHWGGTPGMQVVPGRFQVRLSAGDWSQTQPLSVDAAPTMSATRAELEEQYRFGKEVSAEITTLFDTLNGLREVKSQTQGILERVKKAAVGSDEVDRMAKSMTEKLSALEEEITQVKSKSNQDPINFPPQIDNQLTTLYSYVVLSNFQPTAGARERLSDLQPKLRDLRSRFDEIVATEVTAFNRVVAALNLPPVAIPARAGATDGKEPN
jgi:photosystem II stability/assembly factor-like uncharacterized protein